MKSAPDVELARDVGPALNERSTHIYIEREIYFISNISCMYKRHLMLNDTILTITNLYSIFSGLS